MRAVVVARPRRLALESVPDPTPGPSQVVVRVSACGICGSDLHLHQAGLLPAGSSMGHEFSGRAVEPAGELRVGERVCAVPVLSCGRFQRCRSGLGAIQPGPMITEHIDLAGVPGAFDALEHPTGQCKLLVLPWS